MKNRCNGIYARVIKRFFDIVISALALILFSWLYAILAIMVKIKHGNPVIYNQVRIGKGGKIFRLYKFRSMTNECDENGKLLPDAQRLTKFGRLLRSTSIDEIPSIWNIFKGDLSFVGPRPMPIVYADYFKDEEKVRHDVRPGLTGLAQVNGRNAISWDDKFSYDIEYVNNISILSDVRIFAKTIIKVLKRSDIGQGEEMPISLRVERAYMQQVRSDDNVTV